MIREYTPRDKDQVIHLLRLNTPGYFSPEEEKDLIHYLEHERELYFVAEQEGSLIGCGGINFSEDGRYAKISWDIFHPQYQGKGWGSRLLHYRIGRIKELEPGRTIMVRTSQQAFQFYEKQGFKSMEVVKDYWAPGFDLYRMEYPL